LNEVRNFLTGLCADGGEAEIVLVGVCGEAKMKDSAKAKVILALEKKTIEGLNDDGCVLAAGMMMPKLSPRPRRRIIPPKHK
jgi:hypothetical protein